MAEKLEAIEIDALERNGMKRYYINDKDIACAAWIPPAPLTRSIWID